MGTGGGVQVDFIHNQVKAGQTYVVLLGGV